MKKIMSVILMLGILFTAAGVWAEEDIRVYDHDRENHGKRYGGLLAAVYHY